MLADPSEPSTCPAHRSPDRPAPSGAGDDRTSCSPWLSVLICVALAAATFAAFWPSLHNDFINWDDPLGLIDNEHVRGFTPQNLKWMLTAFHLGHYQPLTWLSFALDYHLWGSVSPRGIHLTSLAWHALNAILFYFLALRLLRLSVRSAGAYLRWGAGLAAMLFALHPMRVESVVWATERRDVVSGMFLMLALLAYLHFSRPGQRRRAAWLALSVCLHACACFSKVICVTLPAVIIVLDFYPLRRLGGPGRWWGPAHTSVWLEKIPFFLVTLVASAIAPFAQGHAMLSLDYLGTDLRIAYTFLGLVFYPYKLLWPVELIPIYEIRPQAALLAWFFVAGAILAVGTTVLVVLVRRRFPAGLAVWLTYLALLSPVTSLTQNGAQFAADRYSYLACLGLAVLVGGVLSRLLAGCRGRTVPLVMVIVVAAGALALLGRLTWRQTRMWRDSVTLWTATLQVDPHSWVANRNLADAFMDLDQVERAAQHYRRSLAVERHNVSLHANAAIAFARTGHLDDAEHHAQYALRMNPAGANTLLNAAYVKRESRQWDDAIELYRRGLQHHPDDARFHAGLGTALARKGDHLAAVEALRRALALTPDNPRLYRAAAESLLELGKFAEAEQMVRRAMEIKPDFKFATKLLARIEARAAQAAADQRAQAYRRALAVNPNDPLARLRLADALAEAGRWREACDQYAELLFVQPDNTEVRVKLARGLIAAGQDLRALEVLSEGLDAGNDHYRLHLLLARQLATAADPQARDGPQAVRLAERLTQNEDPGPQAFGVLAAAYAETGRFDDAVRACTTAIEKARQIGAQGVVERQQERLELYRSGRPFHQTAPEQVPED